MTSIRKIIKGGFWLQLSQVILSILGFLYWFVISMIAGSEAVGITSSIMGFSSLISGLINLGIPVSLQHFVGKSLGERDEKSLKEFFWTSLIFSVVTGISAMLIFFIIGYLKISAFGLHGEAIYYAGIMTFLSSFTTLSSFIVACLETQYVTLSSFIGNIARLIIGTSLVIIGLNWRGATIGLIAGTLSGTITIIICTIKTFKKLKINMKPTFSIRVIPPLIKAGIVTWAPGYLLTLGQWVGVLSVYEMHGGIESGHYYIAFAIFGVVQTFPLAFITLMLPTLSGMKKSREIFLWRVTRVSLLIAGILSPLLFFFSYLPLLILGKEYLEASLPLSILSLSLIPLVIVNAVNSLLYSYEKYLMIFLLGLSLNAPRIILYPILVSSMKSLGAALSFLVGSISGFITAIVLSLTTLNFKIRWRDFILISSIGYIIFHLLNMTKLSWLVTIPIGVTLTSTMYIKLKLITYDDFKEIVYALLPSTVIRRMSIMYPIVKLVFGLQS